MHVILVCGGRDWLDVVKTDEVLRLHVPPGALIVQGEARGADRLARDWAEANEVAVRGFKADWQRDGRGAGPKRNQRMLTEAKPTLGIAFPGGRGTADMVARLKRAGVPVIEVGGAYDRALMESAPLCPLAGTRP